MLGDVVLVLPHRDLTRDQEAHLETICKGICSVLESLIGLVSKYQELGSEDNKPGALNIPKRARNAWKRLKWEPDDVAVLRTRIVSNVTLLNAFNGSIAR